MKKLLIILGILATMSTVFISWVFYKATTDTGTENCNLIQKGDTFKRVTTLLGEPDKTKGKNFLYVTESFETSRSVITFNDFNKVIGKHCLDGDSF